MATANRKKLHKHFIRGRDPMAPVGDGAPNLLQQVKAGQRGSWEEEGRGEWERERERGGDNTVGLREDGRAGRGNPFLFSLCFSLSRSLQHPSSSLIPEDFFLKLILLFRDLVSCWVQEKLKKTRRRRRRRRRRGKKRLKLVYLSSALDQTGPNDCDQRCFNIFRSFVWIRQKHPAVQALVVKLNSRDNLGKRKKERKFKPARNVFFCYSWGISPFWMSQKPVNVRDKKAPPSSI